MSDHVETSQLVPIEKMVGDSEIDTELLQEMLQRARNYIGSFKWCPPIRNVYLGDGIGGIAAVFLFEFSESIGGTDDQLWVVAGDLPCAYLVVDDALAPAEAMERYCELMEAWADDVLAGGALISVFPVVAEPTSENANALKLRVRLLREKVIPTFAAKNTP